MKIKKMILIGLCIICLVGCKKKIPEGISNEMFEIGQDAMEVTEKFLNEDMSRREAVDELTDLGQKGLDICMKEEDDGTLDEKYYSDRLVEQTILLIGENMCIVDGEHDVKETLITLEDLLD